MSSPIIRFVVATKKSKEDFFLSTALGRSLSIYKFPFVQFRIFEKNSIGLSRVYNVAIEESRHQPAVLIFIHDDVLICDYYWVQHIFNSMENFHIAGLAGNKNRYPTQLGWATKDDVDTYDPENLSGIVGHGIGYPPTQLHVYGDPGQEVKSLDGLMLIVRSETLIDTDLRFDEQFDFHFYDMDFCRQAEAKKLRMGTWPLTVVHESLGGFKSIQYVEAGRKYLEKWGKIQ